MARGLSPKQERFIEEMKKNGGNASQAALAAGYKQRQSGDDNMSNPVIQAALKDYGVSENLSRDYLINELRPIAEYATSDFVRMDAEGNLSYRAEAINDPIKSKAIKQLRMTQYGVEIVFHDKNRAIEQIARMIGADQPKQEDSGNTVTYVYGENLEELAI